MRKVLVLEDEDNIRSFVVINLKRAGYDAIEAASGEEALEQLQAQSGCQGGTVGCHAARTSTASRSAAVSAANDSKIGIIMLTARYAGDG